MPLIATATESRIDWWPHLLPFYHHFYTMVTLSKGFSPPMNRHSCDPNAVYSCETWDLSNCSLHLLLPSSLPSLLPLMIESLNGIWRFSLSPLVSFTVISIYIYLYMPLADVVSSWFSASQKIQELSKKTDNRIGIWDWLTYHGQARRCHSEKYIATECP